MAEEKDAPKLIERDGKLYSNPIDDTRYLVRHYEMPAEGDYAAHLKLLESFERRFLYAAEAGAEWVKPHTKGDLNRFIRAKKDEYEYAEGPKKALIGNDLCIALLERGIEKTKSYLAYLKEGKVPEDELLQRIRRGIERDLVEGISFTPHMRRQRGRPDIDSVLDEMKGEPYNIFVGTLPGNRGHLDLFHGNRERKAAKAMVCMDKVADAALKLTHAYPEYERAGLPEQIENLRKWGKERVQLQVEDPDFETAQENMFIARNALHDYMLPPAPQKPPNLPAGHRGAAPYPTLSSAGLLKEAADLLYDMAHIRGKRDKSAAFFVARVEEQMPQQGRSSFVS